MKSKKNEVEKKSSNVDSYLSKGKWQEKDGAKWAFFDQTDENSSKYELKDKKVTISSPEEETGEIPEKVEKVTGKVSITALGKSYKGGRYESKEINFLDAEKSKEPQNMFPKKYEIFETLSSYENITYYLAKERNSNKNDIYLAKEAIPEFTNENMKKYILKKFKEEASSIIKLRHPNIPVIKDYFIESEKYYLVRDYIKGSSLEKILLEEEEEFSEKKIIELGLQICEILEYLHSRTPITIHKDLKLSSFIKNDNYGKIFLANLGLFNIFKKNKENKLPGIPEDIDTVQYNTQNFIQSDIFSLGLIFFQLFTGEVLREKKSIDLDSISEKIPNISSGMEEVIERSLHEDIEKRYPSISSIIKDLTFLKESYPVMPPPIIRVLIVDDMAFMRIMLQKVLNKKKGFQIVGEAANGTDAVKIYKKMRPDIVIMDICMAEKQEITKNNFSSPIKKGGLDAIKDIISIDPGAKIVVCSAVDYKDIVIDALKSGAKDYLLKPFDFDILIKTIRQIAAS